MSKPPKPTRKQHYVPQFYLRQFADGSGRLWACRRGSDKIFSTRIEDICCERDLHEVRFSEGESSSDYYKLNYIENQLSGLESRLAVFYRRLIEDCDSGSIDLNDRLTASLLIAHLLVRHPKSIKEMRGHTSDFLDTWREDCEITPSELRLLDASGWRGDDRALVELAIEEVLFFSGDKRTPFSRLYRLFASKNLCIARALEESTFISASTPYFIIGPEDDSYEFDFAYMPLSSRYAAFFISEEPAPLYAQLKPSDVDRLNQALLLNAPLWETAFASSERALLSAIANQ